MLRNYWGQNGKYHHHQELEQEQACYAPVTVLLPSLTS